MAEHTDPQAPPTFWRAGEYLASPHGGAGNSPMDDMKYPNDRLGDR